MIKILLGFAVFFALFFYGINFLRHLSGKDRWALTKTVIYSIICTVLTIVALTSIVILF